MVWYGIVRHCIVWYDMVWYCLTILAQFWLWSQFLLWSHCSQGMPLERIHILREDCRKTKPSNVTSRKHTPIPRIAPPSKELIPYFGNSLSTATLLWFLEYLYNNHPASPSRQSCGLAAAPQCLPTITSNQMQFTAILMQLKPRCHWKITII